MEVWEYGGAEESKSRRVEEPGSQRESTHRLREAPLRQSLTPDMPEVYGGAGCAVLPFLSPHFLVTWGTGV